MQNIITNINIFCHPRIISCGKWIYNGYIIKIKIEIATIESKNIWNAQITLLFMQFLYLAEWERFELSNGSSPLAIFKTAALPLDYHSEFIKRMEQVTRIELASLGWKPSILPLNYTCNGSPGWTWTINLLINSQLLCQLSYWRMVDTVGFEPTTCRLWAGGSTAELCVRK